MSRLFAITLFLSAGLLFWVQPMVAKMLLPLLGGSPSVWNTCMVFFQAALLGGYLYAHLWTRWVPTRWQVPGHLVLLALGAVWLPMQVTPEQINALAASRHPAPGLLACLVALVGCPFFMVSSTGPLLQRWFSRTWHDDAKDPYFLYSASNLGSMVALLGYPIVLEPMLGLTRQTRAWSIGYGVLVLLIAWCGWQVWRGFRRRTLSESADHARRREGAPLTVGRRAYWVLLAFVPSSLMLGVTTFMTTDIASIPLLWVLPLTLYLLSFVLVFARGAMGSPAWASRSLPYAALGLVFLLVTRTTEPAWLLLAVHLVFFFVAAVACHGRMASDRPAARHLTEFYIWMSVGGVAGGLFNALVAPQLFMDVIEYPLAVVLACLLLPPRGRPAMRWRERSMDALLPLGLGAATLLLVWSLPALGLAGGAGGRALAAGVPAVCIFAFSNRPLRFGLGVAAVLFAGWQFQAPAGQVIERDRNFFGVSKVQFDPEQNLHRYVHGNTFHGRQFLDPDRACLPLAYYHPDGPFGEVATAFNLQPATTRVAVIGLGAGCMASYIQPGHEWTFYEIDPAVIRIATDSRFFTFLNGCTRGAWRIVEGDARLRLQEAPDGSFGMIILDAFSSDAIPMHLLTRESVTLYRRKLAPGGMLAFHISNRYLALEPVAAALAADAGWAALSWHDQYVTPEAQAAGRDPSHWAVLAQNRETLATLARRANWQPAAGAEEAPLWTDNYSNILSVFDWR